ncbi:hypothetical protein EDB92DRAFT_1952984 [Lactarius akahatsu]|uniref:Uncharacterized protein n=1 Tax=Lactarius akahatsu TaxID=416441 RepID=A0AAD4L8G7_9AGAM|nr:hypothetical protein EDB92DRAFT_1952984 [Lactarius akahatsu]
MSQQMDVGLPKIPRGSPLVMTYPPPTPSSGGDDDASPRKRQRREPEDSDDESPVDHYEDALALIDDNYWKKKGMILGRCVEMWDRFNVMIEEGVSRNPTVDEDDMNTNLQYCLLTEVAPEMSKLVRRAGDHAGPEFSMCLDMAIDIGRKQARRIDANGIKSSIGLWPCINWEPAFPRSRHLMGFNHLTSGQLLCPVTLDWDNTNVREQLCRGVQDVTAADLPYFLWPKGAFEIQDPYKGFLRSDLLVMAYKHVFISPSSAKVANRSTRGGNAALHNISWVTFESVAYIATVVRFALSNDPVFVPGGQDPVTGQQSGFPYRDFYRELLIHKGFLEVEEELELLLQWWNEKIFPRTVYHTSTVNSHSIGAIMREQAKVKHAAREAAHEAAQAA